jgi:hypothetical protein
MIESDHPWGAKFMDQMLCPRCLHPLAPTDDFCPGCGGPVSVMSTAGPFEQTLATGFVYRQGSSRPTKPIVLVGVWLLMAPMLISGLISARSLVAAMFDDRLRWNDSLMVIVACVINGFWVVIPAVLLYKTTSNFLRLRGQVSDDEPAEAE